MRYLITGGSGYFGSLLLRKLLERNDQCRVFDINDADDRPENVEFLQGDIRDYAAIRAACEGIDVVHHNVAQVPLAKDRYLFESVNVQGTGNLLKAALEAGCHKVIYTSSSAVYGIPERNPVTETMIPQPRESYGRAKLEGEQLCQRFNHQGLDVSIIRPRTIIGHGRLVFFRFCSSGFVRVLIYPFSGAEIISISLSTPTTWLKLVFWRERAPDRQCTIAVPIAMAPCAKSWRA